MKLIITVIFSIGFASFIFGQSSAEKPPGDLVVLKSSWSRGTDVGFSERTRREREAAEIDASNTGMNRRLLPNDLLNGGDGTVGGYVYSAKVKVTGARTLSTVEWTITFVDPKTHAEVGRHTFVSKRKLKPGDEVDLSQFSRMPPATILDARNSEVPAEKELISKVTIRKVEYVEEQGTNNNK